MDNNTERTVVGKKQILRFTKANELKRIRIATDADVDYVRAIVSVAKAHNVPVETEDTMEQIAHRYGIYVPCGAVGFLK